jgi:hypothetical protein
VLRIVKLYIQLLKQENGEIMTKLRTGFGGPPKTGFNAKPKGLTQQPSQAAQPAQTAQPQPARTVVPNRQYTPVVTNSPQPGFTPFQQPKGNIFSGLASKFNPMVVVGTILLGGSVLAGAAILNPSMAYGVKSQMGLTDSACSNLEGKFYNGTVLTLTKNILGVDTLNVCNKGLIVATTAKVKTGNSLPRNQEFVATSKVPKREITVSPDKVVSQEVKIKSSTGEDLVLPVIQGKFTYEGKSVEVPKGANSVKFGEAVGTIQTVEPYTENNGKKNPLTMGNVDGQPVFTTVISENWGYILGYNNSTGEVVDKTLPEGDKKGKILTDKANLSPKGDFVTNFKPLLNPPPTLCLGADGKTFAVGTSPQPPSCLIAGNLIAIYPSQNPSKEAKNQLGSSIEVFPGDNVDKHIMGSKDPAAFLEGTKVIIK